jgi:hypothetical protein
VAIGVGSAPPSPQTPPAPLDPDATAGRMAQPPCICCMPIPSAGDDLAAVSVGLTRPEAADLGLSSSRRAHTGASETRRKPVAAPCIRNALEPLPSGGPACRCRAGHPWGAGCHPWKAPHTPAQWYSLSTIHCGTRPCPQARDSEGARARPRRGRARTAQATVAMSRPRPRRASWRPSATRGRGAPRASARPTGTPRCRGSRDRRSRAPRRRDVGARRCRSP